MAIGSYNPYPCSFAYLRLFRPSLLVLAFLPGVNTPSYHCLAQQDTFEPSQKEFISSGYRRESPPFRCHHPHSRRALRGGNNMEAPPGSGSGIILDPGGFILTNNHLVQGVTSVVVGLSTGRLTPGRVVARDFLLGSCPGQNYGPRPGPRRQSSLERPRSRSEKRSSPSVILSP